MPVLVFAVWLSSFAIAAPAEAGARAPVASDWTHVARKLRAAGLPSEFVGALKRVYEPRFLNRVVELNVLLYLRRADDHGPQANDDGAARVRDFLTQNRTTFAEAESRTHVDPAVIASLLYIESRYGRNTGKFNVASVYLDLLQSDRPAMVAHLRAVAPQYRPEITPRIRREIAERAAKKARWALGELKALREIHRRDRGVLSRLSGSFSGAVGMPQFLPSSYLAYARAATKGRPADLTRADDAIHSVAHYLQKSGWRRGKRATFVPALLKYNQSTDYARAILKLADHARPAPTSTRRPSND